MSLFDLRLLIVSGKGGVGRSTLSAALALAAAQQGRRTCLATLYGETAASRALGLEDSQYSPRSVHPNLRVRNLTPVDCVADFATRKIGVPAMAAPLLKRAPTRRFLELVPGLQDLVQLGKIEDMLCAPRPDDPPVDLCILDAPATGHGLTLLTGARAMSDMTTSGPFYDLSIRIAEFLSDPHATGLCLVTLPELLPVQETLSFCHEVAQRGEPTRAILINRVEDLSWTANWEAPTTDPDTPVGQTLTRLHHEVTQRADRQAVAITHLQEALKVMTPRVTTASVPRLSDSPTTASSLQPLADALHASLAGTP